jgi:VTC domain
MADTRESRASATETKFLIDAGLASDVRDWARSHLKADPYGSGPFGDEYHTSSLYFDNDALDVFNRRGSNGRAKYRIRRYSGADYAFIERKMRRPQLLVKRRTQVGLDVISAIERDAVKEGSAGWWFYERIRVRRLEPSCLLSYQRTARGTPTPSGLARLTLDDQLRVAPAAGFALHDLGTSGTPVLQGQIVLELKYRGALPDIFVSLVHTFGLVRQTASKYRLGMTALGHRPLDSAAEADELAELSARRK